MREKLNMNQGWKFFRGEIPYDLINGHFDTYMHSKAQSGRNAAAELFYDGNFESVQLPHDYVIEQEPSEDYNETQGGYNRENAWYRRSFLLKEEDKEKRILILFDGAGKNTEVWINGHPLGCNTSMYNSFFVDITPYVYYGENTNVLSVHIVNDGDLEGWWYEGAGIYRSVWMVKTARIAVDVWGIRLKPRRKDEHIWTLGMDLDLYNLDEEQDVIIKYELQEKTGRSILDGEQSARVLFGSNTFCFEMEVTDPILWNLESCELYRMVVSICKDGKELDRSDASFGFRDIVFDADKGFFLNGKHIKLHGVCMHQDHGRLGVAVPSNILEYRISQLKKIGVNAYRCAHHNPAPELPDICDRLGMLVIDENRKFNFSDETQKQLKAMCYRDMNHPSVILWSVGNEEPLQHTKIGRNLVESMKKYIHRIDPLRPVTIALNGGFYDSYAAFASDVIGVNYRINEYDQMHKIHPSKAIVATESGASGNTRGIYFEKQEENKREYASAYDKKRNTFGSAYADAIRQSEMYDFVSGTFLWVGMDYRGESQWPMIASTSGIMDNCAMEKDHSAMVKAFWTDEPVLHIMPSWNLKGHEGERISICIYTNAEEVDLEVNGRKIGRKKVEFCRPVQFEAVYEPGYIKAVSYKSGEIQQEKTLYTAGEPAQMHVESRNSAGNTGEDAAIFEVYFTDRDGHLCTDADALITCEVSCGGKILSHDSGDPKDKSSSLSHARKMFSGRIQTIVGVEEGTEQIEIKWCCPEYQMEKHITFHPQQSTPIARLELCENNLQIKNFRKWPDTLEASAIDASYSFHDMNTSEPFDICRYRASNKEGYEIFTCAIVIPKVCEEQELYLCWKSLCGNVKIRVFHDHDCWPNPTPDRFIDMQKAMNLSEPTDYFLKLDGFHANEKANIILQVEKDGRFRTEGVFYKAFGKQNTKV